ncbi:MAG TPA: hypothetical protein VHB21_09540 [Minicystis sp.]|nr:hypothetical protein [Minicystis sp.]
MDSNSKGGARWARVGGIVAASLCACALLVGCGGAEVTVAGPTAAVAVATPMPNRTLLRGGDKDKLYIVLNGQKRLTDPKTVAALGIDPATARAASPAEFAAIPDGKPLRTNWQINKLIPQDLTRLQNRTLIRAADSPRIYIIANGQRHWVDDQATFVGLGLNPNEIVPITPEQMAQIPEGPAW